MIHTIDLNFLGTGEAIAAFVIPTEAGGILVETGPHSTIDPLLAGLRKIGLEAEDIHTVLLTHIHFDHAGAAWYFADRGATVYVHPRGHKHLLAPERLYESARQIYGKDMDRLWGEMRPIAADRCIAVEHEAVVEAGEYSFRALHTPGHASHHIAWEYGEVLFTGDVAGVKIFNGPVVPPCPPPDIHVAHWKSSIAIMRQSPATKYYLTHFGPVEKVDDHLDELEARLDAYAEWMRPHALANTPITNIVPLFDAFVEKELRAAGLDDGKIAAYRAANPPYMSVAGLMRYWNKYGNPSLA